MEKKKRKKKRKNKKILEVSFSLSAVSFQHQIDRPFLKHFIKTFHASL